MGGSNNLTKMVLHVYNASLEEFEFSINMEIDMSSEATRNADLKQTLEEISDPMLQRLREEHTKTGDALLCSSCGVAPATRLVHHLLFFPRTQPPRVEDMPAAVCEKADCEALSNAKHWMELEEAKNLHNAGNNNLSSGGGSSAWYLPCSGGEPTPTGCFKCHSLHPAGGEGALQRCSRCHLARYCSAACQRSDWPLHKQVCHPPTRP